MKGQVSKLWRAECGGCDTFKLVGGYGSRDDAYAELRQRGWGTRREVWYCERCKGAPGSKAA